MLPVALHERKMWYLTLRVLENTMHGRKLVQKESKGTAQ
jgi:hypothetical protein